MKKLMIAAAIAFAAIASQAAAVGWSNAGLTAYNGDAYNIFVIGQNGVADIATVTALLDAGSDVGSYAFGGGSVKNGQASQAFSVSGAPTLDAGTYTSFVVLFDSATPTSGTTKYALVSGGANQTKEIGASTASITFGTGNMGSLITADSWKSYGPAEPTPEPTTGLLMLVGLAGLALRRKMA